MRYRRTSVHAAGAVLLLAALAPRAQGQVIDKPSLTLEGARLVAAAAAGEARRLGAGGAIAIVDDGGNLLFLERLDNTFAAAANISIAKARSAALFQRDTRVFEDAIRNGRVSLVANAELLPLQGGVPILVNEKVVGAIGVSGATSAQQDEDIAKAAAQSFMAATAAVNGDSTAPSATYLPASRVGAAFERGKPLIETDSYKIHASRREKPGMAEVHLRDTDIIYVLEGAATIVTGGVLVDGKTTAADEIRGASIKDGGAQRLGGGDVFVVPQGVPHQFTEVQAPFLYYVVKATAPAGGTRP